MQKIRKFRKNTYKKSHNLERKWHKNMESHKKLKNEKMAQQAIRKITYNFKRKNGTKIRKITKIEVRKLKRNRKN